MLQIISECRGSRPRGLLALALLVSFCLGCSAGQGEGLLEFDFASEHCAGESEPVDLGIDFFSIEHVEDLLEIRVQHGSDFVDRSDGIIVTVPQASEVQGSWLGRPIQLGPDGDGVVEVALYLNETCGPAISRRAVGFQAVSGQVTFDSIYAPEVSADETLVDARFEDVQLNDGIRPEENRASLSGWVRFFHNRGRPAQRFP